MEYALVTTAAGLVVAIPSSWPIIILSAVSKVSVLEIQTASAEIRRLNAGPRDRINANSKYEVLNSLKPSMALDRLDASGRCHFPDAHFLHRDIRYFAFKIAAD